MPRDDERAFFPRHDRHRRNRDLDDPVQRGDFALNSPAARYVNPGKAGGVEDVAGRNHVGTAKEHDDVAIAVRCRLMQDLDPFAVQIHVFSRLMEHFAWPGGGRKRR